MLNVPPFCCPRVVVPKLVELLPFHSMGEVGEEVVVQRLLWGGEGGEEAPPELVLMLLLVLRLSVK